MGYPQSEFTGYSLFLLHEFCEQAELPFKEVLALVEKFYRTKVLRPPQARKHLRTEDGIHWYNGSLQVNELLWLAKDGGFIGVEEVNPGLFKGTLCLLVTEETVLLGYHITQRAKDEGHYRIVQFSPEKLFVELLPQPTGMTVFQALLGTLNSATHQQGSISQMIADIRSKCPQENLSSQ